jgi:phosphoribosyl 1,2-cyclic phosphodiesterase
MESRIGWTQRHPDEDRLIDWYCELVEHRCRSKRHAARFFVFDPFNEHDATRAPNQTETQYVGEMMKATTRPRRRSSARSRSRRRWNIA